MAHQLDRQEPGGLLRTVPAPGVPARGAVRHGRDEGQRPGAGQGHRRPGGPRPGLFPQIGAGVLRQRLQDDREQAGLLHIMSTPPNRLHARSLCALCFFFSNKNTNTVGQSTKERSRRADWTLEEASTQVWDGSGRASSGVASHLR